MTALAAVSTSYKIGEFTAIVVLAVLFGRLLFSVFRRRSRPVPQTATPTFAAAPGSVTDSIPPPGMQSVSLVAGGEAARPTLRDRERRNRGLHALAAVAIGAALVFGVARLASGSGGTNSWTSATGRNAKAGFLDGCNQNGGAIVDCNCAFARITSNALYNTPSGFETLAGPVAEFERTHDLRVLPAVYVSAFTDCRRQGSATGPP